MAHTNQFDFLRLGLNAPDRTRFFWPVPGKAVRTLLVGQGQAVPGTRFQPTVSSKTPILPTRWGTRAIGAIRSSAGSFVEGADYADAQLSYDSAAQSVELWAQEGWHVNPNDTVFVWNATGNPVVFIAAFPGRPHSSAVIDPLDPNFIPAGVVDYSFGMIPIVQYNLYRRNDRGPFVPADVIQRRIPVSQRKLGLPYSDTIELEVPKTEDLTFYYKLTSFSTSGLESPVVESPLRIVKSAEEQYAWASRKRVLGIEEVSTVLAQVAATALGSMTAIGFNSVPTPGSIHEGDQFILGDGVQTITFEFDSDGSVVPPIVPVILPPGASLAAAVHAAMLLAINGAGMAIAAAGVSPAVALTGPSTVQANVPIVEIITAPGTLTPVGMAGGTAGNDSFIMSPIVVDIVKDIGQVAVYLKIETDAAIEAKLNNRNNDTWVIGAGGSQEWLKDDLAIIRVLIIQIAGDANVTVTARL